MDDDDTTMRVATSRGAATRSRTAATDARVRERASLLERARASRLDLGWALRRVRDRVARIAAVRRADRGLLAVVGLGTLLYLFSTLGSGSQRRATVAIGGLAVEPSGASAV